MERDFEQSKPKQLDIQNGIRHLTNPVFIRVSDKNDGNISGFIQQCGTNNHAFRYRGFGK